MAETTDRPQAPGQIPPDAVIPAESFTPSAPVSSETYQPLSLLAMAGFGLAVLYTLVVLGGGMVALFTRVPWLMSYWTFSLPLAALIVCWAARTHIRSSEGTLSGLAFTTWGFRVTIVVFLTYGAYYGFTFFAVRLQAAKCVEDFFEEVKQGNLEQAFLLSQGISPKGMDSNQLRDTIEARFNQGAGDPRHPSPFTTLRQNQYIRFIERDGANAKLHPLGVVNWGYDKGGYHVLLKYHIVTSTAEFDMNVDTFGRDPRPDEPKGRQWRVRLMDGETSTPQESVHFTPQGDEIFMKQVPAAKAFVLEWSSKIRQMRWAEVYLDTLKPSERARVRQQQQPAQLQRKLESSQLIHLSKTFWAGKNQREGIEKRVAKTFQLDAAGRHSFSLNAQPRIMMPLLRENDGRITMYFDASLDYFDDTLGKNQYLVDGWIVVSADSSEAEKVSAWQIEAIELDSGRTASATLPREHQQRFQKQMQAPPPPR